MTFLISFFPILSRKGIPKWNPNRPKIDEKLPFGSTLNLYGYCSWLYVDICIGIGVGIVVGVGICIGVCVGVGIGIGVGIGSISQHLASCGIWAGSIWQHLGSSVTSGIIWQHLEAPGSIWRHLTASELAASGGIWDPPAASGSIWGHLTASGSIWHHLGCPAERSELWRLEIEPWPGNQALEAGNRETASIFVKLSTKIVF